MKSGIFFLYKSFSAVPVQQMIFFVQSLHNGQSIRIRFVPDRFFFQITN